MELAVDLRESRCCLPLPQGPAGRGVDPRVGIAAVEPGQFVDHPLTFLCREAEVAIFTQGQDQRSAGRQVGPPA